jgi:hypothetical protein
MHIWSFALLGFLMVVAPHLIMNAVEKPLSEFRIYHPWWATLMIVVGFLLWVVATLAIPLLFDAYALPALGVCTHPTCAGPIEA